MRELWLHVGFVSEVVVLNSKWGQNSQLRGSWGCNINSTLWLIFFVWVTFETFPQISLKNFSFCHQWIRAFMCKYSPTYNFSGQSNSQWKHKAISGNWVEERRKHSELQSSFSSFAEKKTQKHLLCVCWLLEDMSCISYNYPDSCVPICHDFCLEVSGRTWLGFVKISWCHCRHEHT